jgi:hypothetical protein
MWKTGRNLRKVPEIFVRTFTEKIETRYNNTIRTGIAAGAMVASALRPNSQKLSRFRMDCSREAADER